MHTPNDSSWNTLQRSLDASFLQSSSWEIFQRALGATVHTLHGQGWSCLLIEQRSRLGLTYFFAPYGPTVKDLAALLSALKELTDYGRQRGARWLRLEPCLGLTVDSDFTQALHRAHIKAIRTHRQIDPEFTRILDLGPSVEEILAGFSQTARRTIRKHQNQPLLTFKTSADPADMKLFIAMIRTVSDRNNVYFHPESYFSQQAATLMPTGDMWLEFALQNGQPIACIVMHRFNGVATYVYAASLPPARDANASALLLWQAALNAKAAGLTRFDLFGIAPEGAAPSHPWHGFSAFKRQFGGQVVQHSKTLDIPLSPLYHSYRALVKVTG